MSDRDFSKLSLDELIDLSEEIESRRLALLEEARAVAEVRKAKILEREVGLKAGLHRLKPGEVEVFQRLQSAHLKAGVAEVQRSASGAGRTPDRD
jgi:hypothetical protein